MLASSVSRLASVSARPVVATVSHAEGVRMRNINKANASRTRSRCAPVFGSCPLSARLLSSKARAASQSSDRQKTLDSALSNEEALAVAVIAADRIRTRGHELAHIDPLTEAKSLSAADVLTKLCGSGTAALLSANWGSMPWNAQVLGAAPKGCKTIKEGIDKLVNTYCRTVAVEYTHADPAEAEWLRTAIEESDSLFAPLSAEDKKHINYLLLASETFDQFLAKKFATVKRYGMEGCESSMVAIDAILNASSLEQVKDIVIGMAHRGRLNVLLYVLGMKKEWLFWKLKGQALLPNKDYGCLDDVLSHLSVSKDIKVSETASTHVTLIHNPSHLEAVNPVALGKAYAKRQRHNSNNPTSAMCMMVHGDAALIGQGVNAETAIVGNVAGYKVGGVVHVVTNNQLGYTAFPKESRPTRYATDLAKMTGTPAIHINADDAESVLRASRLAVAYRQKFGKDIFVDVVGWRKWGHNELDEPAFTQPTMYARIRSRPTTPAVYAAKLVKEGVISEQNIAAMRQTFEAELDAAFQFSQTMPPPAASELHLSGPVWGNAGLVHPPVALRTDPNSLIRDPVTAADSVEQLRAIAKGSITVPPGTVTVHERLQRTFIEARAAKLNDPSGRTRDIDWATAEALAFGTLLMEGHPIRLTGQDSSRGTFSQRHARLVDQTDETRHYTPLNNLAPNQPAFLEVLSSPLSELAVLGFEHGYSLETPNALTVWEAQFGDFANGAQVMIDTFVSSSEDKWLRQSGMVVLLPHGYDGAGPEHSSSRIERFLQMTNTDALNAAPWWNTVPNMHVINPTTPTNYFHALRRQLKRNYRKPLIVIAPKTLIRHPEAVCSLSELADPSVKFQPVYADPDVDVSDPEAVRRIKTVLLCSGKLYYDLRKERAARGRTDMAIIRIEELAPFPHETLKKELSKLNQATRYVWVQEEPQNQGAWSYVEPRLRHLVGIPPRMLSYVGQPPLGAAAVGSYDLHNAAVAQMMRDCFESK